MSSTCRKRPAWFLPDAKQEWQSWDFKNSTWLPWNPSDLLHLMSGDGDLEGQFWEGNSNMVSSVRSDKFTCLQSFKHVGTVCPCEFKGMRVVGWPVHDLEAWANLPRFQCASKPLLLVADDADCYLSWPSFYCLCDLQQGVIWSSDSPYARLGYCTSGWLLVKPTLWIFRSEGLQLGGVTEGNCSLEASARSNLAVA